MVDVQNETDLRGIKIQRTGVTGVHLPLLILNQPVLAEIRFTVALDAKIRGTHMSRLMEILTDWSAVPLAVSDVEKILLDALEKLDTDFAAIKLAAKARPLLALTRTRVFSPGLAGAFAARHCR